MRLRHGDGLCVSVGSVWILLWAVALGVDHLPVGHVLADVEMPTLDGGTHRLLTNTAVNVLVFFDPRQEHSNVVMRQMAQLEHEMAGKSVHWAAIVSDHVPQTEVEAVVTNFGLAMPVLIDRGDALYGALGVVLTPVTVIVDRDHKLVAYHVFTKINYVDGLRARIQYLLGDIDAPALDQALHPPATVTPGDEASQARRRLKLAETLFRAGNYGKALESATISVAKDPTVAEAHALLGRIFAAQSNYTDALKSFEQALRLDASNTVAREGLTACEQQEATIPERAER